MNIDVPTLLLLTTLVCGTVGVIFLVAWWGARGTDLELRIACTMLSIAAGVSLILMRGYVPDRVSIDIANALIALGLGFGWSAARAFVGTNASSGVVVAGAIVWLVACAFPGFHDNATYRVVLISLITGGYAAACGVEFLRPGPESVRVRRMIAFLCFAHAGVTVGRGVLWLALPLSGDPLAAGGLRGLLLAEPVVAVITFGILGMSLVRGRTEHILRRSAETDSLTGILNRRALMARADLALDRARLMGQQVTLLIFDLDHFKSINDRFGHATGDLTLRTFAGVVSKAIRSNDLFGRIGGEEFAALLVGADAETGQRIADRIRIDLAAATVVDGVSIPATVSVGVAEMTVGLKAGFDELLAQADAALYEAKRGGRDRVVRALALAG